MMHRLSDILQDVRVPKDYRKGHTVSFLMLYPHILIKTPFIRPSSFEKIGYTFYHVYTDNT